MKSVLPTKVTYVRLDLLEDDIGMLLLIAENGATKRGDYVIIHEKDYDSFINSITLGRRLAFTFEDDLYLLSHPSEALSLPKITLSWNEAAGKRTSSGQGQSETQIELGTRKGGKIFLKRNYGDPPPPFKIWALQKHELLPVDLENDFSTMVSSSTSVRLQSANPEVNFGTVQVRRSGSNPDVAFSAPVFKILKESGPENNELDLVEKVPKKVGNALFYYFGPTTIPGQTLQQKEAGIYRFYTLTPDNDVTAPSHVYDDQFITSLTNGKQLA